MKLFLMALVGIGSLLASLNVFATDIPDEFVATGYAEKKPAAPPDSTWTDIQRQIDDAAQRAAAEGREKAQREADAQRPVPPKRPKPAYCNTIEFDLATCKESAQTTYRNDSSSCSRWTYGGGAVGLVIAVGGAYFTGGATLIIYLGAGAAGGATGAGTGYLGTGLCETDKLKARDLVVAGCDTKKESTKLECSTY